jgi:hypothetical protein
MLLLFAVWGVYLLLGITWLFYFISKKGDEQYDNMIGSLVITLMWPFHIIYEIHKKCRIYLNGLRIPSKRKK